MTEQTETPAEVSSTERAVADNRTATVVLQYPIVRSQGEIRELVLTKPKGTQLTGLNIQALMVGDVASVIALLPRIAMPIVTKQEAANLEAEDIGEVAGTIVNFFLTPEQISQRNRMMGG